MANVNQPSFTGGELKPSLHARVDLAKYGVSCKTLLNYIIHSAGGVSNRSGDRYITKAKYDDWDAILVPFRYSLEQTYFLEFGDEYMRVYKDGGLVLNSSQAITGVTKANPAVVTCVGHGYAPGDWVFITGIIGTYELNDRFFKISTVPTVDTFTLTDLFDNGIDTTFLTTYGSGGTVASVYEMATPYDWTDIINAYEVIGVSQEQTGMVFTQSANVMTITILGYDIYELTRSAHNSWTITAVTFAPTLAAPTGLATSGPAASGGASTIKYKVTALTTNYEESLPSSALVDADCKYPGSWVASDYIDLSWSAVSGAARYNVYKDTNGFYGYIGTADSTTFRDDNIDPAVSDSPPEARDPFTGTSSYPGSVTLHNQRRVFARTQDQPDTVFTSQTSNYKNMNVSNPLKDTDALTFTIASEQVNDIKYLLSINDLIGFTGNAEYLLDITSPGSISSKKQSGRGIGPVPPLLIGNSALIVQARGKKIRDFNYRYEANGYDGNDISILSSHLLRKTRNVDKRPISWAYQQEPDSIVWIVHNDGSLSSLTYNREHEVWGFARHETDGLYKRVVCIPEGDKDVVYFIVERTVNGVARRLIERMDSREVDENDLDSSFYVDSGIQLTGNARQVVYGLEHLEGKTVQILADGLVLNPMVVSGGKLDLGDVYESLSIGLPYNCDIQPLDIETSTKGSGSTKGRYRRIPKVYIQVYNSLGLYAGPDVNHLTELTQERTDELMGEPTRLQNRTFAIDIFADWKDQAAVYIRHSHPTPITILSITPDVELAT
jgi:hypothetical protein